MNSKKRGMVSSRQIAAVVLVLGVATAFGQIRSVHHQIRSPQPHWLSLDGLMTGARTLDLKALKRSLPLRIRSAHRLILILDTCSCKFCKTFPSQRNDTKLPGILVTNATPPEDRPASNLTVAKSGTLQLTDEMYAIDSAGLLVDFDHGTVVVALGSFSTWSECLDTLHDNDPKYKVRSK